MRIGVYSNLTLEKWDWTAKDRGIGGSERAHIEVVNHLGKRGRNLISFSPIPGGGVSVGPYDVPWHDSQLVDPSQEPMNWIVFRDPSFLDKEIHPESQIIFIAEDVIYPLAQKHIERIDKYVCLCAEHVRHTMAVYPSLKDKIYLSSNGIPVDDIEEIENKFQIKRDPNKIIYASSPDRGLLLILQNWFRIKERCPEATLSVAYGFANMLKIMELQNGTAWFVPMKDEIERLLTQDGIKFLGRIGQEELFKEYLSSNIWLYPTDWPETSCCVCMEAQAMGCIPIFNRFWALEQNVFHGFGFDGIPQKDQLIKNLMINKVCEVIENPEIEWREEMMQDSRDSFNWEKIVTQWEGWCK